MKLYRTTGRVKVALLRISWAGNRESMLDHRIYRDTMCHPKVTPVIQQLCGANYRLDHLNIHTHIAAGCEAGQKRSGVSGGII